MKDTRQIVAPVLEGFPKEVNFKERTEKSLVTELSSMEGIKFAIYADDINIWSVDGSQGYVQISLQEAVGCVEVCIKEMGLKLSL
ncbi:hypothetical protein HPB50_004388 [Hyalomma asiaticum]|uniref:Uncharacterized protein n=1 Tax=Hyalomma asiaticum TaxID=266040 RepID=A0ACB7RU93_HYAAI|nr:hypothetical protein HPB50_004388 [Hyalomma asiaticum]